MKKVIGLLVIFLLSTAIVSAEVVRKATRNPDGTTSYVFYSDGKEIATQIMDGTGNIIKTEGKIPDGVVKEYYKSGKLKGEGTVKDGKAEGIVKEYYESGKLKAEWSIKNGVPDGTVKRYYESGSIRCIDTYKNGQKLDRKLYDEQGNLQREK
jgi:antitoxin component YwqK of YwqJK toxin-antitoxin module